MQFLPLRSRANETTWHWSSSGTISEMKQARTCERVCSWLWHCPLSGTPRGTAYDVALSSETQRGKETDTSQVKIWYLPVTVRLKAWYVAPCIIPARHCAPAASKTVQRWKGKLDSIAGRIRRCTALRGH